MKQTGATICRLLSAFAVAVLLLISVRALCLSVRAESVPDCGFTPPANKQFSSWEVSGLDSTVSADSEVYVLKDYAANGVITVSPYRARRKGTGLFRRCPGAVLQGIRGGGNDEVRHRR